MEKYPKYLSKFALFSLQMDDSLFREMFTLQILIFSHSIIDPIGLEHKNVRKLSEAEDKLIKQLQVKAAKLLSG